jgi:hypothetical protein
MTDLIFSECKKEFYNTLKDYRAIYKNFNKLKKKYLNKWIVIKNKKIIAVFNKYNEVIKNGYGSITKYASFYFSKQSKSYFIKKIIG